MQEALKRGGYVLVGQKQASAMAGEACVEEARRRSRPIEVAREMKRKSPLHRR